MNSLILYTNEINLHGGQLKLTCDITLQLQLIQNTQCLRVTPEQAAFKPAFIYTYQFSLNVGNKILFFWNSSCDSRIMSKFLDDVEDTVLKW